MELSEKLKKQLEDEAGMTPTQANSAAVLKLLQWLTPETMKDIQENAVNVFNQLNDKLNHELFLVRQERQQDAQNRIAIERELREFRNVLLEASKAEQDYGEALSEKRREVTALYGSLLQMGGDSEQALKNAGYIVYAYLGGQAREAIVPGFRFEGDEHAD